MHKLSAIDTGFLLTESHHSPKHVGGLQILRLPRGKGSAWLRNLLEELQQVPPGYPFDHRFRDDSLLQPALVPDEHLEMDYHVRHTVLPGPGSDEQLNEMISRLHANLLDRDRPLWEFHLIEGLSDRRFAFYTKIHHAIADGVTFARWFNDSGSTRPDALDSRPIWARDEAPPDSAAAGSAVKLLLDGAKLVGDGIRTARGLTALGIRLAQRTFFERDRNAVLPLGASRTALNVPTGSARCFSTCHFSLDEFHGLARTCDASVNDLLLAVSDLAVNRYLEEIGAPPGEPLVVYMPVNLRHGSEDEGNRISLLQVKLASRHDDPLEVLNQVRRASRSTRDIYSGVSNPAVQLYSLGVALLPLGEELLRLDRLMPPAINLVVSNVPGAAKRMYFRGAEVTEVYPVNTLPPAVALSITACSYAGGLYFGLVGGRTALPDFPRLKELVDEAYEEFRQRIAEA